MVKSVGIDVESVRKFKKLYRDRDFLNKVFSKREIEHCLNRREPWIAFAGKFCAKEAVIKVLKGHVEIKSVEIVNASGGDPEVFVDGKIKKNILCSISHTEDYAAAIAILN